MKSLPNLDFTKLGQPADVAVKGGERPVGKYGNLKNFLKERAGIDVDDATLDKKLRSFFEDMITEILKSPKDWDRTRNINFMELYNYLQGEGEGEAAPAQAFKEQERPSMQIGFRPGAGLNIGDNVIVKHALEPIYLNAEGKIIAKGFTGPTSRYPNTPFFSVKFANNMVRHYQASVLEKARDKIAEEQLKVGDWVWLKREKRSAKITNISPGKGGYEYTVQYANTGLTGRYDRDAIEKYTGQ